MSDPKTEAPAGPYTNTRTVTLKFTPFELTMTTDIKASHPPTPCGCGDKLSIVDLAAAAVQMVGAQMAPGAGPTMAPIPDNE